MIFITENGNDEHPWQLGDCYFLMYQSLLMLGSDVKINTLRKRTIFITICLTGMFLYLIWEAMLISYFTLPTRLFPFNSWEEFLTKTDSKVKVVFVLEFRKNMELVFQVHFICLINYMVIYHIIASCTKRYNLRAIFSRSIGSHKTGTLAGTYPTKH